MDNRVNGEDLKLLALPKILTTIERHGLIQFNASQHEKLNKLAERQLFKQ